MTAHIRAQTAILCIYDTFTATITQLFQVTIPNTLRLENQLFHLYAELHTLVDSYLPDEEDNMPPLEDLTDNES